MDGYRRSQVPPFGNWEYYNYTDGLPFTQCFETAGAIKTQQHRDLYVAADLYQNDVLTPAVILLRKGRDADVKKQQQEWGYESPSPPRRPTPKAVDEDLYKIPPELLHSTPKTKRRLGFFSCCLSPAAYA